MRYSDSKYDTLYLLFYAVGNVPLFLKHRETVFDTSRRHVRTQWVMRPFFEATIGFSLFTLGWILIPRLLLPSTLVSTLAPSLLLLDRVRNTWYPYHHYATTFIRKGKYYNSQDHVN